MDKKIELQHNMFLLINPEWYFKELLKRTILVRKIDIKQVFKVNGREYNKERNPIYSIVIEMKNGTKYEESYESFRLLELGIERDPEAVRDERFREITNQLSENNYSSICKGNMEE